ncbi:MAG TPA: nitrate- and nitrite sensing domain-containing protein [Pseudonocardiaceae bacterium]|nr:nitrate- and nitrite sensing domain-containing protein [Pseudonocardiaceae bacterium]
MISVDKRGFRATLRFRVLVIAVVPSLVLLIFGIGVSGYLLVNALQERGRAHLLAQGYQMTVPLMPTMSQERRVSMLAVSNPAPENRVALARARHDMDGSLAQFRSISSQVGDTMPPGAKSAIGNFVAKMPQLIGTRQAIDAGRISRLDVYRSYNEVADAMILAVGAIGQDSIDKDVALDRAMSSDLIRVSDWLDRANALAAAALAGDGLTVEELHEYDHLTQGYRAELDALAPRLVEQQGQLGALRSSRAWEQLSAVENAIVEQEYSTRARSSFSAKPSRTEISKISNTEPPQVDPPPILPVSFQDWQNAAHESATMLSSLGLGTLGTHAAKLEADRADTALVRSLITVLVTLCVIAAVVIIAIRLSSNLIRRLVRLRSETLRLADEHLPQVVERLRAGEQIDVAVEVPELDYGDDEIGQVAAAFNKAQQTAVAAAVQEAKTREGINAVFLNIARRSQTNVHHQLQVLDAAERAVDNPDQLELLFQLDHSTTRERRNAENLIILGGGQLGRQWRNSVSLVEIVRSAVAEAEQYTRVTVARVPDVLVDGRAVADLIHLLSELIDNATAFSPPGSPIEVRGNPVGKGLVVEVEDQGLGIEAERRESLNKMFRDQPDFGLVALLEDPRIGFFVVARLAHQHGMRVSLAESTYGGVRAGVLVPSVLITRRDRDSEGEHNGSDHTGESPDQISPSIVDEAVLHGSGSSQLQARTTEPQPSVVDTSAEKTAPPGTRHTDDRPALPRRRPQEHLASQLQAESAAGAEGQTAEPDFDLAAKRAQSTLSAFQRGTERGRTNGDKPQS